MASSMSGDGGSEAIDTSTRVGGSVGVAGGGFGNSVSHTGSAVSAGAGMSELSEYPQDNEYANRVQKRVKVRLLCSCCDLSSEYCQNQMVLLNYMRAPTETIQGPEDFRR